MRKTGIILAILSASVLMVGCTDLASSSLAETESKAETAELQTTEIATDPTVAETEYVDPNATPSMLNALEAAKNYLDYSHFSHDGLIGQLEYEKYSTEDATYAADNCGADWNEQALKCAQSYVEISANSYTGLIDQLVYEKYTQEQATYGVDNCGADWNEQAKKSAESYMSYSTFSRQGLIDQLIYDGYTQEQAEIGAASVGL